MPLRPLLLVLLGGCAPAALPTMTAHPSTPRAHATERAPARTVRQRHVARLAPPFARAQPTRNVDGTEAETALVSAP
jgi:hypothetical protein